ncbi:carbohydrate ABC transporter membrane protein 2 (CUT1 family) [Pseudonocardia hierapolitana]|uniref:Carbohydrate ABC transporter membrane protein 2 (CUT1 family) n=1 Tax=Pseudonocardia hierapolitana TaxID=1128676 RepID=A0A561SUM2_9PSEU|nr:carbohydrate ABC transporter permease [Pseudonocardia hierapolitana]TWF78526.1 carbohydrate ABC transporter membrane protein 2 (CUT1 family) [Pseudonocardia hierapolitana]
MTDMIRSSRARRQRWLWGIPLWLLALAFLTPFAWMLSTAFKRDADAFTVPMDWIPDQATWDAYAAVLFGESSIVPAFANSVFVAALRVLGEVVTATMAGYAFARIRFAGRDTVFLLYLATAIIPAQLLLVPRFVYFQTLGLYDTLWALILPGMFTVLGTFLMRQFFVSQPAEFAEAARIDGASEWQIFWRIYVPMATPVMSALGILAFVWSWNDYEAPLVLISSPETYTLPLSLSNFTDEQGSLSPSLSMAASVVSIVPVLIVFLVLQKRFVQAMTHTGIK